MAEVKMPMKETEKKQGNGQDAPTVKPAEIETHAKTRKLNPDAVVQTRKGFGEKLKETFLLTSGKELKEYIVKDVLVPGAKYLLLDTVSMLLTHQHASGSPFNFGNNSSNNYYYGRYGQAGNAYNSIYKGRNQAPPPSQENQYMRHNQRVDYKNIVLRSREDAMYVVDQLRGRIREFGEVTVAELIETIGMPSEYIDTEWGWRDERDIGVRQMYNGFLIDVREAIPLRR